MHPNFFSFNCMAIKDRLTKHYSIEKLSVQFLQKSSLQGYWSTNVWFCSGSRTSRSAAAGSPWRLWLCKLAKEQSEKLNIEHRSRKLSMNHDCQVEKHFLSPRFISVGRQKFNEHYFWDQSALATKRRKISLRAKKQAQGNENAPKRWFKLTPLAKNIVPRSKL